MDLLDCGRSRKADGIIPGTDHHSYSNEDRQCSAVQCSAVACLLFLARFLFFSFSLFLFLSFYVLPLRRRCGDFGEKEVKVGADMRVTVVVLVVEGIKDNNT